MRSRLVVGLLAAATLAACGGSGEQSGASNAAATNGSPSNNPASSAPTTASDQTTPASDAAPPATKPSDPKGVLRVGANLNVGAGVVISPEDAPNPAYLGMLSMVHGTPLMAVQNGLEPYLAESVKVVDDRTVTVTLRANLHFHDGKPYEAQNLADGLLAHRDATKPITDQGILKLIDRIEVLSPTELKITTVGADAGRIPTALAGAGSMVASPGSDGSVGTGPYKVVSFDKANHLEVAKWDQFVDADKYQLAGIKWVHVAAGEAAQNALRAGQVDLISTSPADLDALVASGDFGSVLTNNQGHYYLSLCRATPPFDNPKIRRALNLAIDREQLNEFVMGGKSEVMTQQWPPSSPNYTDVGINPRGDKEAARKLLQEAGGFDKEIPFAVYSGVQNQERLLEVVQAQLEEIGLEIKIIPVTSPIKETITPATGGGLIIANINNGLEKVLVPILSPKSPFNACDGEDPELGKLMAPLRAGNLTDAEQASAWHTAEQYLIDNTLAVPLVTQPSIYVYNKSRVQGLRSGTIGLTGATVPSMQLDGVSMIAR